MPGPRPSTAGVAGLSLVLGLSGCAGGQGASQAGDRSSAPAPAGAHPALPPRMTLRRPVPRPRPLPTHGPVAATAQRAPHGATVTLSFDDGPWPASTPQILDVLARNHAPAVFCVIGRLASEHPALVRREIAAGHQLCDHSRDHDLHAGQQTPAYQQSEVTDGLQMIEAASGNAPVRYYRQPGGLWDATVVEQAWASRLAPLRWTVDPRDWARPSTTQIVARVLRSLRPGGVILLHDGGGDRSRTLQALTWLLPHLRAQGWRFVLPAIRQAPLALAAAPQ